VLEDDGYHHVQMLVQSGDDPLRRQFL
jgi:hypothetical protein